MSTLLEIAHRATKYLTNPCIAMCSVVFPSCSEDEFAWGIQDASYDAFPNRSQCQSQPMSDRISFPLLAIVVDTHPGD